MSLRRMILVLTAVASMGLASTTTVSHAEQRAYPEGTVERALQEVMNAKRVPKSASRNVFWKWVGGGVASWALDKTLDYLWENGLPSAGNPSFACAKAGVCN